MAFTLTLSTNNAAFGEDIAEAGPEIARILREVADKYDEGFFSIDGAGTPVYDVNGNKVGFYLLSSRPE